jgi:transcriptional regulator with XRE-family HTH domain
MRLQRLREWRESRGLMQRELAEEADVSEFSVLRAERGDSMRVDTARKIAEALGVSVADLLERPPVPLAKPGAAGPGASGAQEAAGQAPPMMHHPYYVLPWAEFMEAIADHYDKAAPDSVRAEDLEALHAELSRNFEVYFRPSIGEFDYAKVEGPTSEQEAALEKYRKAIQRITAIEERYRDELEKD